MLRASRWSSALVVAAAVTVLTGCGTVGSTSFDVGTPSGSAGAQSEAPSEGTPDVTITDSDEPSVDGASGAGSADAKIAPVVFRACPRALANPVTTHLRPGKRLTPDVVAQIPGGLPPGAVRVEHVADLTLAQGTISGGNGYDAATGPTFDTVKVSPRSLTVPVSIAVYDSPQTGRRVLFVEVRIAPGAPVTWTEERRLNIITDGGDGGFVDGSAASPGDAPQDGGPGDYVEAFYPKGNSGSGNICVQRVDVAGKVDAVLFSTGFGDGRYPTFVGRDANGAVVSVVHDSLVVPWSFSGLPGTPPAGAAIS